MAFKTIGISDELQNYVIAHGGAPDAIVSRARRGDPGGVERRRPNMQIAPEQAPFLTFMTRALSVRHAVEVGTFTGLSALSIARGLPADGT